MVAVGGRRVGRIGFFRGVEFWGGLVRGFGLWGVWK